jgi:hypothetical protein
MLEGVSSNADLELVVVLDTNDPYALALAEGCLREAEIPFFELNQVTTLVNDVDPFMRKWRTGPCPTLRMRRMTRHYAC